jgi:hypothetical protein
MKELKWLVGEVAKIVDQGVHLTTRAERELKVLFTKPVLRYNSHIFRVA